MVRFSSSRIVVFLFAAATAGALAVPLYAQGRRLSEPSDLMLLAGRGASLGVTVRDPGSSDAKDLTGVIVEDVRTGTPAEQAGLRRGDVIVEYDGEQVRSARQFARLVQETPSGRSVKATVIRNGSRTDLTLTPRDGERLGRVFIDPDELRDRLRDIVPDLEMDMGFPDSRPRLGATVENMTPQLAAYFGGNGVLVTSVRDDSPAFHAGLKAGDVIVSVDGRHVATRRDLVRALADVKDQRETTIAIVRDKKESSVKVTLERPQPRRETQRM